MTDTTHGCGHCGETFTTHDALNDHISGCNVIKCLVCDTEFDSYSEKMDHTPCDEADPVYDPEAEFREQRRERKRQREFERKQRKRKTLY